MGQKRQLRNVGIFAHVDAGKTTTTEHILYESGSIRALGSVDAGTAQTDSMEVERERGISVQAAVTRWEWKGVQLNLVDTPGHADFLSEVERSLRVIDGAVLIVSAVEGVQAQTEVVWQALAERGIPVIIYVNKLDRVGADPEGTLMAIRRLLSSRAVPVQAPFGTEERFSGSSDLLQEQVNSVELDDSVATGSNGRGQLSEAGSRISAFRLLLTEAIAEQNEELLESYLETGGLAAEVLMQQLDEAAVQGRLYPVLFGASAKGIGIVPLMDAMIRWLPESAGDEGATPAGVVFKLERHPVMGRVAYVRMYKGAIRNRDTVWNVTQVFHEKATQIRRVEGQRQTDTGELLAGDIAAVYGLSRARIGDILGSAEGVPRSPHLAVPLLTVQVEWQSEADYPKVVAAFQELADEDPLLELQWLQEERELHLKVMGPIQIEVLTAVMQSRFGLAVSFGPPSVIYKETPASAGEGFIAYTMPKPCWAILRFHIEPGPRGSGLIYHSRVRPEHLLERYQNEVARRVPEALQQGLKAWEVIDLKVTLVEGEHHVWHTHPLDFAVATPMGLMDGLARIGTRLLEPLLSFRLSVPEEFGGKVMNELVQMRSEFESPDLRDGRLVIHGLLPVATSLDFPARLGTMTKGRGTLSASFSGYRECPPDVQAERKRQGVNPLDQSRYILAVRNALSSS